MPKPLQIGLIGDYNAQVLAHQAIPKALDLAAQALERPIHTHWLSTDTIIDAQCLAGFDGLWCVPGSPYRSMDGALLAIRHAREHQLPFLGTCAGFQHAVIEYARHVLGWADAEHAETAPQAARPVIALLECALVEVTDTLHLRAGTRLARAYGGAAQATEGYRCRYGLNPQFHAALEGGGLRVSALDAAGEVRAMELDQHPFFVVTLFQPERAALQGRLPGLVSAFAQACSRAA